HLVQQLGGLLEAVADGPGQRGELLGGGGEPPVGDAGLLVEGAEPLATAAAVVVGPPATDRAEQADEGAPAVLVVAGGVVAVRAGHAGGVVADFFWASRCS